MEKEELESGAEEEIGRVIEFAKEFVLCLFPHIKYRTLFPRIKTGMLFPRVQCLRELYRKYFKENK